MFLVLKHIDGKDCGVNRDGTVADLQHAELMDRAMAKVTAERFGGTVADERRIFGDDVDDEEIEDLD
jgi:hypothetical protein